MTSTATVVMAPSCALSGAACGSGAAPRGRSPASDAAPGLAAAAALKERERDDRDGEIVRLKGKVGEMNMETELLREKIARLEAGAPLALRRSRQ